MQFLTDLIGFEFDKYDWRVFIIFAVLAGILMAITYRRNQLSNIIAYPLMALFWLVVFVLLGSMVCWYKLTDDINKMMRTYFKWLWLKKSR